MTDLGRVISVHITEGHLTCKTGQKLDLEKESVHLNLVVWTVDLPN